MPGISHQLPFHIIYFFPSSTKGDERGIIEKRSTNAFIFTWYTVRWC